MAKKKKIHPRVSKTALKIEEYYRYSPADAVEQHATLLVTHDYHLVAREKVLYQRKQELEQDKKRISDRLKEVEVELEKIDELKKNFVPTQTKNFDEALHTIILRLRGVLQADDEGKWDLKKVPIDEISMVCKEYSVPMESVLSKVPKSLKSYIEGYTVIG